MQAIKPDKITLPKTSVELSRLIYGAWRLADDDTSVSHVQSKVEGAMAEGMTTFDHADIYGDYTCEAIFGQVLKAQPSLRDQIELITKCDIALISDKFPDRYVKYYDTSPEYIYASVDQSLKNLATDYIDLLLLHRPDPLMDAAKTGRALDALIESGKVRAVGVSNFQPADWRLLQAHMQQPICANQIEMSVLVRDSFVDGTLSSMQLDGLHPIAWSPLGGGGLFGDDAHHQNIRERLLAAVEGQSDRVDVAAFAWLLAHPAHISPIVGTNNPARISGMCAALETQISRQAWFDVWTAAAGQEVP